MKLRDYQVEAVNITWSELFKKDPILLSASCGLGKTIIACSIMIKCLEKMPGFKCVFLVDTVKLVRQTYDALKKEMGDVVGIYCASLGEKNTDKPIIVSSIQSIKKIGVSVNLIFIDECHMMDSGEGSYTKFINEVKSRNTKLKVIGMTATPYNNNGYIYGEGKFFPRITWQKDLLWAQENGFLVKHIMKHQPEKFDTTKLRLRMGEYAQEDIEKLTSDVVKIKKQIENAIPQLENRKKVAWCCSSINHAEALSSELSMAGEISAIIHSNLSREDQLKNLDSFENKETRNLIFVTMLNKGYDYPPIDAIVLMRPTRSPVLYVQCVGRGLRLNPEKSNCLVLDFGGVIENLGPLHDPFIKKKRGKDKAIDIKMKFCPTCLEYCPLKADACPECQHQFKREQFINLQNLTTQSYRGREDATTDHRIETFRIKEHISKQGNNCTKIEYVLENLFPKYIDEYFRPDLQFSKIKMLKRFKILGVEENNYSKLPTDCYDHNLILRITKNIKGHHEVIDLFRDPNSNRDLGLVESKQDIRLPV